MRNPAAVVVAVVGLLVAGCQIVDVPPVPPPTETSVTSPEPTASTVNPTTSDAIPGSGTSGSTSGPVAEPSQPPSVAASPTTASVHTESGPPWGDGPVEHASNDTGVAQEITDVRIGAHEGFDRVVLDVTGDEPGLGWYARFTEDAIEDPSDLPLNVDGDAFLEIAVTGIDWTSDSTERYDGSAVSGQGTTVITQVKFGGLFEGQQQVVIGLRSQTAYRVFALSDPARIVIDVQHR